MVKSRRHTKTFTILFERSEAVYDKSMRIYLTAMAVRLFEMHRILKPTGSIYLHCDDTANHYLKLVMDSLFGSQNYRNEIAWQRTSTRKGNLTKGLARDTDYILRYSKTDDFVWNAESVTIPYDLENLDEQTLKQYSQVDSETHRRFSLTSITSPTQDIESNRTYEIMGVTRTWRWTKERMRSEIEKGHIIQTRPGNVPRYKRYLDEQKGKSLNSIWINIANVSSHAGERTGYPTQKPLALLDRIIKVSSNENDIVLDPFCGCATACIAAEKLRRQWIGIDISPAAETITKIRLEEASAQGALFSPIQMSDITVSNDPPCRTDKSDTAIQRRLPAYQAHKNELYGKQEGQCSGCKLHYRFKDLTVDHITPQSKGGTDHIENLQLLCGSCNSIKHNHSQDYLYECLKERDRELRERLHVA